MKTLPDVCRAGDRTAFVFSLRGTPYATHWTIYERSVAPARHRLVFSSETDLSLVGLGGPKTRVRAELLCDDHLFPIWYRVTTDTSVNVATFDGAVTLVLPDGSTRTVEPGRFRGILGENLGQLDLFLRVFQDRDQPALSERFFSLGGVTTFDYELAPLAREAPSGGARWYRSSFLEELLIGSDGALQQMDIPRDGVTAVRADVPLPPWHSGDIIVPALTYTRPADARFAVEDVFYDSGGARIGTTLTIPQSPPPHPLVLFIAGSGAKDRHGIAGPVDLGSHEIVDFLSQHGWLGVRFDSRGAGATPLAGGLLEYGFEETLADARAVLSAAIDRVDIDEGRIALVGHSQGALTAVLLAAEDPRIGAIVLLAPPGRPLPEVLADQIRVQARWLGLSAAQLDEQLEELRMFVDLVQREDAWEPEKIPPRFYVSRRHRKWYADHLSRDLLREVRRVRCPILICQGAKDFQVSVDRDARAVWQAARDAGVPAEIVVFEKLDHLFKPVDGESHVSQYYDKTRRVARELEEAVLDFLNRTLGAPRPSGVR